MKRIISMGGVFAASLFLGLAFCPCVMPHESLAFDSNSIRPVHGEYVPGELLVKFRADAPRAAREDLHRRHGLTRLKEFKRLRIDRVKITDQLSMEEAIGQYAQDPSVEYAEPNYLVQSQVFPNDIRFTELWGLSNTGQTGGTPGADIRAPQAWGITTGSSTTVVAVIDSGIDYSHPDLAPNMWVNEKELNGKPGVDDDGNGYIDDIYGINAITNNGDLMDDCGHGTHVSGTIGAAGNNSIGVVGVNWNVKIIGCKFLDWSGSGSTADALECLEYVKALKDRGVNIVATNNSWGGGGYSSSMYEAIRAQGDILFVAAAGNSAFDADEYAFYPAAYELPNVVSVAATDYNDAKASFSNYGRRTIYVGAPGDEILSTLPGGSYGAYSGTSMATPHVTGLAALLKSQDQGRDWKAIKNLILSGGDDLASMDTGTVTGKRISAYGSVTCSDRPVFSALRFPEEVGPGEQIVLSALSINCESPVGPVTVLSSSGEQITLADDGVAPDLAAGDGVFTASWTPIRSFAYLDFSSAAGTERVILELGIATSSLPPGSANKKYIQTLIASGGVPPYTWSIVSGSLPAGLSLNAATGEIAGTPVSGGISTFTVQLTDAVPASDTKTLSLTIAGSAADLAVTSVTGPQTALAGGQAAVTARITNQGNRAAGPFSVGFYLSYD
ncbi:MAG: S8 family serine peptidase, partial [Chloroflexota bacterium]